MKEESRKFSEKYQEEMEKYPLPEEIRNRILVKKCLKEGKDSWVLLGKEKLLGTLFVVKWAKMAKLAGESWHFMYLQSVFPVL